ncbi:hypothetical protein V8E54_013263 [Elaphomyces granulatus]
MHPSPKSATFKFPSNRLLKLRQNDEECNAEREEAQSQVDTADKGTLHPLHSIEEMKTNKNWASRVLGHVVYSPPILLGAGTPDEQYTDDYAIIKVDDDKIDRTKFNGNAIYLGDKIPSWEFTKKMHPSPKSAPFKFPSNRLLKLRAPSQSAVVIDSSSGFSATNFNNQTFHAENPDELGSVRNLTLLSRRPNYNTNNPG